MFAWSAVPIPVQGSVHSAHFGFSAFAMASFHTSKSWEMCDLPRENRDRSRSPRRELPRITGLDEAADASAMWDENEGCEAESHTDGQPEVNSGEPGTPLYRERERETETDSATG